jgi:hypothetical protein
MTILPKCRGEYAVYENATGTRYHIEWTDQRGRGTALTEQRLHGLENVSEGMSQCPKTKVGVERFVTTHSLVFVEMGR